MAKETNPRPRVQYEDKQLEDWHPEDEDQEHHQNDYARQEPNATPGDFAHPQNDRGRD